MSDTVDRTATRWAPGGVLNGAVAPSERASATAPLAAPTAHANEPPVFRRTPRLLITPSVEEIQVEAPPPIPAAPSHSLVDVMLPVLLGALVSVGAAAIFLRSGFAAGREQAIGFALLSFAPVLATIFPAFYTYRRECRRHDLAVVDRREDYRAYLEDLEERLELLGYRQRAVSVDSNPSPEECRLLAESRDPRLWERLPHHPDFLSLRLGLGALNVLNLDPRGRPVLFTPPPLFTVRRPPRGGGRVPDPLLDEAIQRVGRLTTVDRVAMTLPLAQAGAAGLAGPRSRLKNTVRALLVQLATHHAPNEVKLVITVPESERADWEWVRWLPHTWDDSRTRRFIAADSETAYDLLAERYDVLRQRQLQRQAISAAGASPPLPAFVFVFADPSLLVGPERARLGPLLQLMLNDGPSLGAYGLFLEETQVPQECGAEVDLTVGSTYRMQLTRPTWPNRLAFDADSIDVAAADAFARLLAPLRPQGLSSGGELQYVVPLLDFLLAETRGAGSRLGRPDTPVSRVEDLPIADLWRESRPFETLAAPIGVRAGGEALRLDVHEEGHGPHGLQAGTTGSGKSELLQSLIASVAVHFHPHEVAFVLIDYKGGGMANAFLELPHRIGTITNLEGSLSTRALISLDAELKRRQRLFAEVGVNTIDDYLRLSRWRRRMSRPLTPLPHVLLIVDEFAELAQNQPEFMDRLVSAARLGRSLGLHLLLATQQPAGVVNDQIWGNARFHICLRVARPEDSSEVLKRPDAAAIRQPGRGYFQVGMDEVFDLFQAAYGGAPYLPDRGSQSTDRMQVALVALDGTRRRAALTSALTEERPPEEPLSAEAAEARALAVRRVPLALTEPPRTNGDRQTQLEAVVARLRDVAEEQAKAAGETAFQRLPSFWLEPLPETLHLQVVREKLRETMLRRGIDELGGWNGQGWQSTVNWLSPAVGLEDDPAGPSQNPMQIRLGESGHLVVFGAPGSGKTTFVQTLIISLALDHSPEDVWIYVLDFGGQLLKRLESLPHVGAVLLSHEAERLTRLMRMLLRKLERRKERLAEAGAATWLDYRRVRSAGRRNATVAEGDGLAKQSAETAAGEQAPRSPAPDDELAAIVIVLENYAQFAAATESYPDLLDALHRLVREGVNVGMRTVLTASATSAVPYRLSGDIAQAVALELYDAGEYSSVVGRTGGFVPKPGVPGRGLVKRPPPRSPLEFQAALPAPGEDSTQRSDALDRLMMAMASAWQGRKADRVGVLPTVVPLDALLPATEQWAVGSTGSLDVPLGLDASSLEPLMVDLDHGPHFLITGGYGSGKSTLLQTWLLALAERLPPERLSLHLVDFAGSPGLLPLRGLPQATYVADDEQLGTLLARLQEDLDERHQALADALHAADGILDVRRFLARYQVHVMAVDGLVELQASASEENKEVLSGLVGRGQQRLGFHLLLSGQPRDLSSAYDDYVAAVKTGRAGFLLGTTDDSGIFDIQVPRTQQGKALPAGRGFYVRHGHPYQVVQVATALVGNPSLPGWIRQIRRRQPLA